MARNLRNFLPSCGMGRSPSWRAASLEQIQIDCVTHHGHAVASGSPPSMTWVCRIRTTAASMPQRFSFDQIVAHSARCPPEDRTSDLTGISHWMMATISHDVFYNRPHPRTARRHRFLPRGFACRRTFALARSHSWNSALPSYWQRSIGQFEAQRSFLHRGDDLVLLRWRLCTSEMVRRMV